MKELIILLEIALFILAMLYEETWILGALVINTLLLFREND